MKLPAWQLVLTAALVAMCARFSQAGYDFTVGPKVVSLRTRAGTPIAGAMYLYHVLVKRLYLVCPGEFPPWPCWENMSLAEDTVVTDASGTATIPALHFHSRSPFRHALKDPVVTDLLHVAVVPFKGKTGADLKCDALPGYFLWRAGITFPIVDGVIDASDEQLSKLIEHSLEKCRMNEDRFKAERYVEPFDY